MDTEKTKTVLADFEDRMTRSLESSLSSVEDNANLTGMKFLLAVSGGSDSISLLRAMHRLAPRYGWSLHVGHLNHGLRGEAADEDAQFTRDLCRELDLKVTVEKIKSAPPEGKPTQAWAREIRLAFLENLAAKTGHRFIVSAHNADDQVETVIMRMLRGSGLRGLSGIPACRKKNDLYWIRPMLNIWRSEILEYLTVLNQGWREDISNESRKYLRNEIRHDLVPILEKAGGAGTKERILDLAELFGSSYRITRESVLADMMEEPFNEDDKVFSFKLDSVTGKSDEQLNWLWHEILSDIPLKKYETVPYPVQSNHCRAVTDLVRKGKSGDRLSLPGGLEARLEYGRLLIGEPASEPEPFCLEVSGPGEYTVEAIGARIIISEATLDEPRENTRSEEAYINPESCPFPWKIRCRREGDMIFPVRLNGHGKSVKKLLIDCKIARHKRSLIPVFESGGRIFWIPDLEIDVNLKKCGSGKSIRIRMEHDTAAEKSR